MHEFYRGKTWHKKKGIALLGCGTYFIDDNTIQYSTVLICCGVSNDGGFILWYAGGVGTSTVV